MSGAIRLLGLSGVALIGFGALAALGAALVEDRVEALLAPPVELAAPRWPASLLLLAAIALAATAAAASHVLHWTETVVHLLLHWERPVRRHR